MKTKLIYNRKNQLDKVGEAGVTIQITLNTGQRLYKATGVKCVPHCWDAKTERIKVKDHDYLNKNLIIERELGRIADFYKEFLIRGKEPTAKDFKDFEGNKISSTFNEFFEKNITLSRSQSKISIGTLAMRKRTLQLWNEYLPVTNYTDLTPKRINEFRQKLIGMGFMPNTIDKHLRIMKTMILMAKTDDVGIVNDPFAGVIRNVERSEKKYSLTFEQVDAIKALEYTESQGSLFHTRNMFLFSCRTAFRFGDVLDLRSKHISNTENGWYIQKQSIKLKAGTYRSQLRAISNIFGDNIAEEILMLYYDENNQPDDRIFPSYSHKTISENLLKISKDARLQTKYPLTFHIARHTCATHLAAKDVGLHKIMRIGGWDSPLTIKHYIDMADDLLGGF